MRRGGGSNRLTDVEPGSSGGNGGDHGGRDRRLALAPARDGVVRVSPTSRKALLTIHVVVTVSVLGADLVLLTLGIAGLRGAAPHEIYPAAELAASWLVAPLAVASLVTGVLLALFGGWGLFRHGWVTTKLAITVVLTAVVLFVLEPRLSASAAAAASPAAVFSTVERVSLIFASAIGSTFLVVNVALAVFKPRRRLRTRRNSELDGAR